MPVKLIALDLDGTLLRPDKTLSARNRAALDAAAEKGILIVPTTGRLFRAMPEPVRTLPYLRYAIAVDGAEIREVETGKTLYEAYVPLELAFRIYDVLDTQNVAYDGYVDNRAFMPRVFYESIEDYMRDDPYCIRMVHNLREPVDDLRETLRGIGHPLQKLQAFMDDVSVRPALERRLREQFPEAMVSHSLAHNVEINAYDAEKGHALQGLCRVLGIGIEETVAFGDGLNDLGMIKAAGTGVAMANAEQVVLDAADAVTLSNVEDGVAAYIERYIL